MNPALRNLNPNDTLQNHPNTRVLMFAMGRLPVVSTLTAKASLSGSALPAGQFIGVLATTGPETEGRISVGGWTFDMAKDEEQLALAVPIQSLVGLDGIELRVQPLMAKLESHLGSRMTSKIQWRGRGRRETTWQKIANAPDDELLADERRALRLRNADDLVMMDWYHREPTSVFYEMDDLVKRSGTGGNPEMRLVFQRGRAAGGQWYRAQETPFKRMR